MLNIFSKPRVLIFPALVLIGGLTACTSVQPPQPDPLSGELLYLRQTEIRPPADSPEAASLAYFGLGLNRELQNDYPAALDAFLEAIRLDPDNDDLYMVASQRLIMAGRKEDAFGLLEKLLVLQPDNLTARRWLAKLYLREGETEKAKAELKRAVAAQPRDEQIYIELIQLLLKEQNLPEVLEVARLAHAHADTPAKSSEILAKLLVGEINQADDIQNMLALTNELNLVLTKAMTDFPKVESFALLKARLAIEKDQWEDAFTSFESLDRHTEGNDETRARMLVLAIRSAGGQSAGVKRSTLALEASEPSGLKYYFLGLIRELNRDPLAAMAAYEKALDLAPDDFGILRKLALLTYQNRQTARATALLDQVLAAHPDDPEVLLLAGQLSLGAEQYADAQRYLSRRLYRAKQGETLENPAMVHAQLAMALLSLDGQTEIAADAMVAAATEPGNLEWVWQFQIQKIYTNLKQNEEFADAQAQNFLHLLEDISDRLPDNPEIEWLIGRSHVYRKSFPEAVSAFERCGEIAALSPNPDLWLNEEYYFDLAAAYERAGDLEKSMALFAQIIKEHPNHHPSLNYLAYMWAERAENLDSALDYVKRALVLDPENGAYLDTLGWIYYQQQAYKAAYRELLRAAEVIPDDPVVTEHLGDVLMQLGRPWEARAYYRISLSLDPAERTEIVQNALEKADRAVSESLSGRKISP